MNTKTIEQEPEEQQQRSRPTKQHVTIEWAQSEWFKIYLQMARRDANGSGEEAM